MKLDQWEIPLENYIDSNQLTPFAYGTFDCCLFAANCVLAETGVDIATEYRGLYTDEATAFALLSKVTGGFTVEDTMTHACTQYEFITPLPSVFYAQRGDVVSMVIGSVTTLGIVSLDGCSAWFTGDSLTKYPISECNKAWGIR